MEGPGADSEEKRVLASDLDTVMVDSLKALDLIRPIREADMSGSNLLLCNLIPNPISPVAKPQTALKALVFIGRTQQSKLSWNLVHGRFVGD